MPLTYRRRWLRASGHGHTCSRNLANDRPRIPDSARADCRRNLTSLQPTCGRRHPFALRPVSVTWLLGGNGAGNHDHRVIIGLGPDLRQGVGAGVTGCAIASRATENFESPYRNAMRFHDPAESTVFEALRRRGRGCS